MVVPSKVILEKPLAIGERFTLSGPNVPSQYVGVWFEVMNIANGKIKIKIVEKPE